MPVQVTKAPAAGDLRQILCRVARTYREGKPMTDQDNETKH